MIAIPLTKNFSWRNPPIMTIALILINCLIFVIFQHSDNQRWRSAQDFYIESGLVNMEIEYYRLYLSENNLPPPESKASFSDATKEKQDIILFKELSRNTDFQRQLAQGALGGKDNARWRGWNHLRSRYDDMMDQVVSYKYGFRPAYPDSFSFIACMFLHGGWGHLIGNMIFLWLIGCLIEYGCRHVMFPVIYLIGGMAGTALFWALNPDSAVPLVGASGAISGIMGAFTVFYGIKKVRLFINLGFYFNYLKFPAIVLLPLWVGNEMFQMVSDTMSPVAYAAHLGGLVFGAFLGWGTRQIPGCLDLDGFASAETKSAASIVEQALAHMGALEYPQARELLVEALEYGPEDLTVWQHIYTIDRQNPANPHYHQTISAMLDILYKQEETYEKASGLFLEYLKTAKPPRLSVHHYLRAGQALTSTGRLKEAQQIISALIRKAPHLPTLSSLLYKLAQAYREKGRSEEYRRCLGLVRHHFPMSEEARYAVEQLNL